MKLPERTWVELYEFAIKYARVCRSHCAEVDEAVNEMMIEVLKAKEWKSPEYAKRMMRNRMMDIFRHDSAVHRWERPLDEGVEVYRQESDRWDVKIMVDELLASVPKKQARTYRHIMTGRTINEITAREGINRSTVHRHISRARELMTA